LIILLSIRIGFNSLQDNSEPEEISSFDLKDAQVRRQEKLTKLTNSNRKPASTARSYSRSTSAPEARELDKEKFKNLEGGFAEDLQEGVSNQSSIDSDSELLDEPTKSRRKKSVSTSDSNIPDPLKDNKEETHSGPRQIISNTGSNPTDTLPTPVETVGRTGSISKNDLICNASVGEGTYSSPVSVSLSCSTAASISYCISSGSCCDPTTGSTYASPLPIGGASSSLCLSFIGRDAQGLESKVTQHVYNFSYSLPDLNVAFDKLMYQTTQLEGFLSMTSADFGGSNISGGVLNFKAQDPALNGLTNCEDQVMNGSSLTPLVLMPDTTMAHLNPSMQLDVFFGNPELEYGDNFITSYIVNNASAGDYACSTSKLTLEDFPFFETNPTYVKTTSGVHEFSGSFTSVSFFEAPAPVVNRSPAGSSIEDHSTQELRSGLYGIFY